MSEPAFTTAPQLCANGVAYLRDHPTALTQLHQCCQSHCQAHRLLPAQTTSPNEDQSTAQPLQPKFRQTVPPSHIDEPRYQTLSQEIVWKALRSLDPVWVYGLVLRVARAHSDVGWEILNEFRTRQQQLALPLQQTPLHMQPASTQSATTVNRIPAQGQQLPRDHTEETQNHRPAAEKHLSFDEESRAIWFALHREHRAKSGAAQCAIAEEVAEQVVGLIEVVRDAATTTHASSLTKETALCTLRNVGESICSAPGALGIEVRKLLRKQTDLRDAMMSVLRDMNKEQREHIANANDACQIFHEKVLGLVELGKEADIFKEMGEVAAFLRGEVSLQRCDKVQSSAAEKVVIKIEDDDDDEDLIMLDMDPNIGARDDCVSLEEVHATGGHENPLHSHIAVVPAATTNLAPPTLAMSNVRPADRHFHPSQGRSAIDQPPAGHTSAGFNETGRHPSTHGSRSMRGARASMRNLRPRLGPGTYPSPYLRENS
ncbi:hypothetical protein EJ04DRAFT_528942 [Polyplosphaeria fusca]|uniref:Uncharacterized protein n=1 Tax=Polyplosphaeria fusca TaxID=682080 RepID=A0A9P4QIS0_9PLEO|nr:hypothetical protein EJ04DRAFT_528942 [Polyplosphaeria fusca]